MRRLLMGAVTAGAVAIMGAGPAAAAPIYGPSVVYQINAQHTGVAYGSPLPKALKRRWVSPDLGYMDSQPVIAHDLRTGKQLWKRTLHYDDTHTTDLNDEGLAYG